MIKIIVNQAMEKKQHQQENKLRFKLQSGKKSLVNTECFNTNLKHSPSISKSIFIEKEGNHIFGMIKMERK